MPYALYTLPTADKDLDNLPAQTQSRVLAAFEKLKEDPRRLGAKKGVGEDWYRYRVGDYRIKYLIDDAQEIDVVAIKHRQSAYD